MVKNVPTQEKQLNQLEKTTPSNVSNIKALQQLKIANQQQILANKKLTRNHLNTCCQSPTHITSVNPTIGSQLTFNPTHMLLFTSSPHLSQSVGLCSSHLNTT